MTRAWPATVEIYDATEGHGPHNNLWAGRGFALGLALPGTWPPWVVRCEVSLSTVDDYCDVRQ